MSDVIQAAREAVEKAKARAAKEVQEAEARVALVEHVIAHLPAWIIVSRIHPHDAWVHAVVELDPMLLINIPTVIQALPPVPMAKVDDGCVSFRPISTISEKKRERATITELAPFELRVAWDYGSGNGTKSTVTWFTQLGDRLVRVDAPLSDSNAHFQYQAVYKERYGQRVFEGYTLVGGPGSLSTLHRVNWYGEVNSRKDKTFYWDLGTDPHDALQ